MRVRDACRALLLVALAASTAGAGVQQAGPPRRALLDVPYLAQTPQLCGGAAVAMVLRYWGERDVVPQDFARLIEPGDNGIRTGALAEDVARRGWQALAATPEAGASAAWLADETGKGRPIIALLEVAPATYHYVVVIGVTATEIVYHDPARAPFRVLPMREFDRQWAATNRWTLMVLPGPGRQAGAGASAPPDDPAIPISSAGSATSPCAALIGQSVTQARAGALDDAERGLVTARALCPANGAADLELGGVRFLQRRYAEAGALAAAAVEANPSETAAWELLATSRYLQGDRLGALDAWNAIGRPRTDVVHVEGVERLDHPFIVERAGFRPRAPITRAGFARAEHRLNDLPTVIHAALTYVPRADGSADITATLLERPVLPVGPIGWGAVGVSSAFRREVRLLVAGPQRGGEMWDVLYRWRANRPRVRLAFAAPAPGSLPGVLGVEALWERQSYEPLGQPLRDERRRIAVSLGDWLTDRVRWTAGGAFDRFDESSYVAVEGRVDTRWMDDHVSTLVSAGYWTPTRGDRGFATGLAQVAWRSAITASAATWLARGGVMLASAAAPLTVWPVAGSGESRGPLLRGHELHHDGIIVSDVFGRRLGFASLEYQHPVYSRRGATAAVAAFADAGRSWQRPFSPVASSLEVDVGAGLRLTVPGYEEQLRIDLGYGLRDGRKTLSAGYVLPWGQ